MNKNSRFRNIQTIFVSNRVCRGFGFSNRTGCSSKAYGSNGSSMPLIFGDELFDEDKDDDPEAYREFPMGSCG